MKRSKLIALTGITLIVALGGYLILVNRSTSKEDELLIEINNKFECDRRTLDYRGTDIYCGNVDLFKKDLQSGNVIN